MQNLSKQQDLCKQWLEKLFDKPLLEELHKVLKHCFFGVGRGSLVDQSEYYKFSENSKQKLQDELQKWRDVGLTTRVPVDPNYGTQLA